VYLDQEAVTNRLADWSRFQLRLSIVTENDLQAAKLTFLGKIPLVAFELTSLLRLMPLPSRF
jgi:hypothetical protein